MDRRALGRDASLSRQLAWTSAALVVVYAGALAHVISFAVLWAREDALAVALASTVPVGLVLGRSARTAQPSDSAEPRSRLARTSPSCTRRSTASARSRMP
jgi:hypothetical protein